MAISLSLGVWFPMENTQVLKPTLFCVFNGTTKEAAEKVGRRMEMRPSAAKAVPIFNRLCTG
jgi:hypothetical protein